MIGARALASFDTAAAPFTALFSLAAERLKAEYCSTPFYQMTLTSPKPSGLAAAPRDFRPVDPEIGRQILLGRVTLAGSTLEIGVGGDPWDTPSPSRAFAVELHRFSWLGSLVAEGSEGAAEALRLVLDWQRLFGRYTPFFWGAELIERRVFNLACSLRKLTDLASDIESSVLIEAFAQQGRHLGGLEAAPLRRAERLTVAALAAQVLAGEAGAKLNSAVTSRLSRALHGVVLADGGVKSRCPEHALDLLFDLLTLDDALLQRGQDAPPAVAKSIDRLTGAVRFFTLGDGRLAAFQGGEAVTPDLVQAALAHDDAEAQAYSFLPYAGFHRMAGQTLLAVVDAAPPASGAWSLDACAQPLALEITCGADRLISNTGWSSRCDVPAMRLTQGGSTAGLGERSAGRPLSGLRARGLGARLVGGPTRVTAKRHENEGGLWLELSHNGWVAPFGFIHERRLFLDPAQDELRGEDRFEPSREAPAGRRRAKQYAVRFHLPPEVQVSLARDKRSVLVRGPSSRGWWFRNDAPDVLLEASVFFEHGAPKRASQIVLGGPLTAQGARVRWKLTPVDASDPHAGGKAKAAQATR